MISKTTIDKVFETARVEEVIGDFVQLKRSGGNYKGLSPFTKERTASFMVSPAKQIWKDFSSGKGGTVVSFLMEHEHFTYPEAIRFLANRYGIEIEEIQQVDQDRETADEKESLYLVSEFAKNYFKDQLWNTEKGRAVGLSYFKERGFKNDIIQSFDLGYAPDEWNAFTEYAIASGYLLSYLEKSGLTIQKEDKSFDRFKGRVIFPIHSMSGRILGFGGRILTNDKKAAKYLNSPASDIYDKSKILYGLYQAKKDIAKEDLCYLVEGYTDVIQLHQSGLRNVVSSSGTALTEDQVRLIRRITQNITLLFDSDPAGIRASLRGVDLILEQDMSVRVCTFPEGEDPDSFARSASEEELRSYLESNSKDFIQFKASLLQEESANDPIKRSEAILDMVGSISKVGNPVRRELYIQECARIMDISEGVLFSSLAQIFKNQTVALKKQHQIEKRTAALEVIPSGQGKINPVNRLELLEEAILRLLLNYGDCVETFDELVLEHHNGELTEREISDSRRVCEKIYMELQSDEIQLSNTMFQRIYDLLMDKFLNGESLGTMKLEDILTVEEMQLITHLQMIEEKYVLHDWERRHILVHSKANKVRIEVMETILNLRSQLVQQVINELKESIREKQNQSNQDILEKVVSFEKLSMVLGQKLNNVLRGKAY